MTGNSLLQLTVFFVVLTVASVPLGKFIAHVLGENSHKSKITIAVERFLFRACGINSKEEMHWKSYAYSMLLFNLFGLGVLYILQRFQSYLPMNPAAFQNVPPDLAFNTATSFATNTNWQAYGGETTMSYLTQMIGLTVQNFVSAASGIAVLIAFIRGFTRKESKTIGNFWVDLIRTTVWIFLPLSLVVSILLVSQGVVQTFEPSMKGNFVDTVSDHDGKLIRTQEISLGPVASQVAIKQLGTNGGGFFNVNSAHPFENPTPISNFIELVSILLIAAGLCHTFGALVRDSRQGWALYAAMSILLLLFLVPCVLLEQSGNPHLPSEINQAASDFQSGGNMEGKEVRFGIANSALWAVATTAASNGSVNSMHDSYTPIGGLIPMVLMQLGEVVFGGVGSGLYGMIAFAIVAVFIAGLMVGRTPEYLGKKIEPFEMKMVSLVVLIPCGLVLIGTAFGVALPSVNDSMTNPGPHGLSQVLYAYSSMGNNNGSAFAGFGANVPFHNIVGAVAMFLSRFWIAIPILALAGSLAAKKSVPVSAGTLPTHTPLFVGLLLVTILLVGALTFLPALALGPIAEQLELFVR